MSLLEVMGLSHSYGDKQLYTNASFELYKGEHMGVVGQNGAGKSTLLKILMGEVVPDDGYIKWQSNIKVGILDQYAHIIENYTVFQYLKTAFNDLYDVERKLNDVYMEMASIQNDKLMKKAAYYQDVLEEKDFYNIESNIAKVATGLGITAIGMDKILKELSGGQRAKVILAKLLLEKPDILILDEPTNFLDKEHVTWLSDFLNSFEGAFIIVSHDFDFLDKITTCICDIENSDIRKYNAKYSIFVKQKENLREDYIRRYSEQQRMIKKTEEYIAKNKVRAATAKIARGRQKQLDRVVRIAPPSFTLERPFIQFKYVEATPQIALRVMNLEVGYYYPLLPKINFSITNRQKVVICGFNGIGKSTLLKTIIGELKKISGDIKFGENIKIGYYEQDLNWQDGDMTPFQIISDEFPKLNKKEIMRHLSQCGVKGEHAMQPIKTLSGGEQSKVKLCRLTLIPCNLLILDEITNHIDVESKEALKDALINYKGTIILVSHEESFYKDWADKIINVEKIK